MAATPGDRRVAAAAGDLAAGATWTRWKVKKHFHIQITDTTFTYARKHAQINSAAALDGIYVLRTSVSAEALCPTQRQTKVVVAPGANWFTAYSPRHSTANRIGRGELL